MPDYWDLHHFSDEAEVEGIEGLFRKTVVRREIEMVENDGVIVQGKGLYLILEK